MVYSLSQIWNRFVGNKGDRTACQLLVTMEILSCVRNLGISNALIICITVKSPGEKTRFDTSLGLLTKKFVALLRSAPDGVSIGT